MAKARTGAGLLMGCLLVCGSGATAWAAPTVAQMLGIRPKQPGVNCSTPKPEELEACKVELVTGPKRGSTGWLLRDPQGRSLRRFFDTNGPTAAFPKGKVNVLSYYLDGVEVYRETDSNLNGKIDQYRWLNSGGMKWGTDADEDGKIESWRMISADEASQEIFQAVLAKDFARVQALWITDTEVKSLGLPASEVNRIRGLQEKAQEKFQNTITKLDLGDKAHWVRLEAPPPQCLPADAIGAKQDIIHQTHGSILYENNGKNDFLQTGELIQVGTAWRLVDAPSIGDMAADGGAGAGITRLTPELQKLIEELHQVDTTAGQGTPADNAALYRYHVARADVLQKIVALVKQDERDQWVRQLADGLGAAAQSSPDGDKTSYERLLQLEGQIAKEEPGSQLAAYVTYCEISAENSKMVGAGKAQEQWLERLKKFVQEYPQAENAADAVLQLGMVSEFLGKETEAKKWYGYLATNYSNATNLADKARGALRRLDLEGKPMELAGPTTDNHSFDITSLRGKVAVVYYWASYNPQCIGDFARLKVLLGKYSSQGLELVCINLDNSPPEPGSVRTGELPGTQLYQPGGLDSPLAKQYGVMVLPHMFLVGKDGKVVSRTIQIATLEDELKKQLK